MVSPPNQTKQKRLLFRKRGVSKHSKKNGDDTSLRGGRDIIQESKYATMPTDPPATQNMQNREKESQGRGRAGIKV
jgi:hypothetical protein